MTPPFARPFFQAAFAAAAIGAAALAPVAADAAPLAPAGVGHEIAAPDAAPLATPVQYWGGRPGWGPPPDAPAWGWRRHHHWGPRPYYARPAYGPRCTVRYVRQWDEWRGGFVSRPVRRCW